MSDTSEFMRRLRAEMGNRHDDDDGDDNYHHHHQDTEHDSDYDNHHMTTSNRWRSTSKSTAPKQASHWNMDDDEDDEDDDIDESDADQHNDDYKQDYTSRLREKLHHQTAGRMNRHRSDNDSLASMEDLRPNRYGNEEEDEGEDYNSQTATGRFQHSHYTGHLRNHSNATDDTHDDEEEEEDEIVYPVKRTSPPTSFGKRQQRSIFTYGQSTRNESEAEEEAEEEEEEEEEDYFTKQLRDRLPSRHRDTISNSEQMDYDHDNGMEEHEEEEEEEEESANQSKELFNSRGSTHSRSQLSIEHATNSSSHMNLVDSTDAEEDEEQEEYDHSKHHYYHEDEEQEEYDHNDIEDDMKTPIANGRSGMDYEEDQMEDESTTPRRETHNFDEDEEDEDPTTPIVATTRKVDDPAMARVKSLMERMQTDVSDLIAANTCDSNDEDDDMESDNDNKGKSIGDAPSISLFKDDVDDIDDIDDDIDDDDDVSSGDDPETDRRIEEALNMSSSLADLLGKARQSSSEREAAERKTRDALNAGQDVKALMGKLKAEEEASKAAAAAIAEQDIGSESDEEVDEEEVDEAALAAMLRRQPPPPLNFSKNMSSSPLPSNASTPLEEFPDRPPTVTDSQSLNRQSVGSALSTPVSEKIRSSGSSVTSVGMHHMPSPKDPTALMPPPTPAESVISFRQNMASRLSYFFRPNSPLPNGDGSVSPLPGGSDSLSVHQRRGSMWSVFTSDTDTGADLLLARLEAQNRALEQDPKSKRLRIDPRQLQMLRESDDGSDEDSIDWDFWGQLVNDYETVVKRHPKVVTRRIQAGIPARLRGMVWRLIAHANDPELEMVYAELLKRESQHEKVIRLDLPRTFPNHDYFREKDGAGQAALFNVVRAYSLFDIEVGYCQGIPFIVGPLLLHMPEDEAFCTLVRLMQYYNLRGHYTPSMEDLHVRLHQFEKLLAVHHPDLSRHLNAQGIQTTMYASQWYMTFFAYKFPLSMVYRIMDIIFAEGVESLHRFAVALMRANRARLLLMGFEELLTFLKTDLFEVYRTQEAKLVMDASNVKMSAKQLEQWASEYHQETRRIASEQSVIESLRRDNKRLESELRRSEKQVNEMSQEQCSIASQLVEERMKVEEAAAREQALREELAQMQRRLDEEREKGDDRVREQLDELIGWKSKLMMQNAELESQIQELTGQVVDTKMQLCMAEAEKMELKAALGKA